MKPGVDGEVFIANEAGENGGTNGGTNQNVPPFSPASFAINTSPSTPGFILAITPDES